MDTLQNKTENKKRRQSLGSHPMWGLLSWLYVTKFLLVCLSFLFSVSVLFGWIHQGAGLNIGFFGHHEFASWVIASLITGGLIWGYLEAAKAFTNRYSGGYLNGWAVRVVVTTLLFGLFSALFFISSFNISKSRMFDVVKPQTHNTLTATSVRQYDDRILANQKSIAQFQQLIDNNIKQISKYDKIKLKRKYNALWGVEKTRYKNLKTDNAKLQKQISFYLKKNAEIEDAKQIQQKTLIEHNKQEEQRYQEEQDSKDLEGRLGAGFIETGLFLTTIFIFIVRGKKIKIDTGSQTETRSVKRAEVLASEFLEKVGEDVEVKPQALANEIRTALKNKGDKKSLTQSLIESLFGYTPIKTKEKEEQDNNLVNSYAENEKPKEALPQEKKKSNPINGKTQREILKTWDWKNHYDLPKIMNLDKEEFQIELINDLTEEEEKLVNKIRTNNPKLKEARKRFFFEVLLLFFFSVIEPNTQDYPLVYRNGKLLKMNSWTGIATRNNSKNGVIQQSLAKLTKDENSAFHFKNLRLIQREPIQEVEISYN